VSQDLEAASPHRVMSSPRIVDIEITSRCNLRCLYCYYYDNPTVDYTDLATGEWLRFFEELGSLGVMSTCLAGGEPFLRPDLRELLQGLVQNRMRFRILSNGTVIRDEMAKFIAGTKRCDYVQISIDGSIPESHDVCRGEGSFVRAVEGIETLRRHGVPVQVRVTIHHYNVHDLEGVARFLLDDLKLPSFSVNSAGYLGSCRKNYRSVMLTTEDRMAAMAKLLRLNQEYQGRISAMAGPLAEAKYWRIMEAARKRADPPFSNGGRLTGCGCPFSKINIRADGAIVPCTMLAHIVLGRINTDGLQEVWQNSPELNRLRHRGNIKLSEFEFCRGCDYIPYCTGSCPGLAFNLTGQVDHPSPDFCLRTFLADGGKIS